MDIQQREISLRDFFITLKDWTRYLLTKWLWIGFFVVIGGIIGAIYASSQKPEYTATLSFALEDEKTNGGISGALGLTSQFGFDIGGEAGGAFSGANLIELMRSRLLIEKTLLRPVKKDNEQQSLADFFIDCNNWREGWNSRSSLKDIRFPPQTDRSKYTLQQDSILGLIYETIINNQLMVSQRDKKVSIIYITAKSKNEAFAKSFVESLASEVSQFYVETKTKKAADNMAILERQTDSVRSELNGAIAGVASSTDNTFNLNPALNIKRTPTQRRQVDVQANTVILTELIRNLELAKVTLRKETPLIQVIDRPILPLERKKSSPTKGFLIGAILLGVLTSLYFMAKRMNDSISSRAK